MAMATKNKWAKLRKKLNMNQRDFWSRVKVTQSGGSRYETGRPVPEPVQVLLALAYGTDKERDRAFKSLGIGRPVAAVVGAS